MLSKKWGCGLMTTRNTIKHTTQLGVRSAIGPLTRRYRTDILQLHYRRLKTRFHTDTMFSRTKSLKGNTCAQVYTDGEGFVWVDPIASKSEAGEMLQRLVEDAGIPNRLAYDGSKEQTAPGSAFQNIVRKHRIIGHTNEAKTQKFDKTFILHP